MSSITKNWTEADFRKELRSLDQHVKKTQGIELVGAELDLTFSDRARCRLGAYYYKEKMFRFSLPFFNSDVPEACAVDVIRHEYAHYYTHVVFGKYGHGSHFKKACRIVNANPSTYYSKKFEDYAREKEEREAKGYQSTLEIGQQVIHPNFGLGIVLEIKCDRDSALLTVDFGERGIRRIDEIWLQKNGVI